MILVTGGTGFIGQHLVRRLATRGEAVRVLVRPARRGRLPALPGCEPAFGDIADRNAVQDAARSCRMVIHLAACRGRWQADPGEFARVNVQGTRAVLAAARAAGAERVVHVSTYMVFGPTRGRPHTEADQPHLNHYVNEYQRTKVLADAACAEAGAQGLPIVTVYPTTVFGPSRARGESPITDVARRYARTPVVPLVGGDECRRNLVYVDDVVDGLLAAAEAGYPGEGYILGGANVSPRELLDLLAEVTGRRVPRVRIPAVAAYLVGAAAEAAAAIAPRPPPVTRGTIEALYTDWSVSSHKAEQALGYRPTPLPEGLRRALELEPRGERHRMLTYHDGELRCDGVAISALARQAPTPFFLFSESQLGHNYETLASAFGSLPGGVAIDYCMKTNYELGILALVREFGAGVMVTCDWELQHALAAGFAAERITYHAPYKSDDELAAAVEVDVGLIHVYSADELRRLARVAADHGRPTAVSIRVPAPGSWLGKRLRGWYADRLGVPYAAALDLLERAAASEWLRPRGLSVHVGTQLGGPSAHVRAVQQLFALAAAAHARGVSIVDISLGGGWPSDTLQPLSPRLALSLLAGQEPPALAPRLGPMARTVAAAVRQAMDQTRLPQPPLVRLEPGRGIVGSAGLLVTRVVARQRRWLFVDGTHNVLPESGLVGQREVRPAQVPASSVRRRWHVSGRTLNTADIMAVSAVLPDLQVGDLLVFLDAGAYSLSRATRYAGTIPDAYLLSSSGTLQQIRHRDTYDDIVGSTVGVGQRATVLE